MEEGVNGGAPEMAECSMGKQANVPMKYFEEGEEKEILKSDATIPLLAPAISLSWRSHKYDYAGFDDSQTPLMWLVVTVHFSSTTLINKTKALQKKKVLILW